MPSTLTNADAAKRLRQLADLLEIGGEPVFRVIAYRKAADAIEALPDSVVALIRRGETRTIPGVGKGIADHLRELYETGTMQLLEEAQQRVPLSVTELLTVPDIGPKRAKQLYEYAGIANLAQLREAAAAGALTGIPGLGPKGAQRIMESLASLQEPDLRLPLPAARRQGEDLIGLLRAVSPEIEQITLAGSIRRFRETIGDLDIVAAAEDTKAVVDRFSQLPVVNRIEMHGENRCRVHLQNGQAADLRVLPPIYWGSQLHHFTGSKFHNVHLRDIAIERGWSMSEYGLKRGDELKTFATEEEIYAFLGMDFILPPMRENNGEIELAQRHELPEVIGFDGLRGDLHMHSTWSDGTRSIEEMAIAARARGYDYICLTDHSHGLGIVNGLDAERLRQQRVEIDAVNEKVASFRVLQGCEVEVLADGSLDLPDDALRALDLVIASVHTGIRRGKEGTTARAIAAIRHPLVDILAHPTGRVLGQRGPGDFDVDAIVNEAAATGTAVEINGSRIDLNDVNTRGALGAGCTIEIGSDAHSIDGLGEITDAIGTAQRAWVPADRVLNARPLEEMLASLKRKGK
jgi:DNA polymerase (family 10)